MRMLLDRPMADYQEFTTTPNSATLAGREFRGTYLRTVPHIPTSIIINHLEPVYRFPLGTYNDTT
jgi:hypothetical protein